MKADLRKLVALELQGFSKLVHDSVGCDRSAA